MSASSRLKEPQNTFETHTRVYGPTSVPAHRCQVQTPSTHSFFCPTFGVTRPLHFSVHVTFFDLLLCHMKHPHFGQSIRPQRSSDTMTGVVRVLGRFSKSTQTPTMTELHSVVETSEIEIERSCVWYFRFFHTEFEKGFWDWESGQCCIEYRLGLTLRVM